MSSTMDNVLFYGLVLFAFISCLSMAAQNIVAVALLVCFIIKLIREKNRLILDDSLVRGLALFFAAAAISAIFAYNKQTSAEVWFNYLYRFSIFFIAAFSIKTRRQVQMILIALAISLSITDLYALWQWLHGAGRVSGFLGNPMHLAGGLIILMPCLFLQVLNKHKERFLFVPALILAFLTLVINQTRGAWIAVIATAIISGIILKQHRKQIAIGLLVLLLLFSCLISLSPQLTTRFQTLFDMQYQSNAERLFVWHSAIHMFIDHPVTGIGLGNFYELYQAKYKSPLAKEPLWHAHNIFLHIFVETGTIGGAAFLYLFYMMFRTYYAHIASQDSWVSSMAMMGFLATAALLLQGMTEYTFATSIVTRLFWFVSGVIYASVRMEEVCKKAALLP